MTDFAAAWATRHDGACEGCLYTMTAHVCDHDCCHCYRRWLEERLAIIIKAFPEAGYHPYFGIGKREALDGL